MIALPADLSPCLDRMPGPAAERIRMLQDRRAAALEAGALVDARGLSISLDVLAILFLPDEVVIA